MAEVNVGPEGSLPNPEGTNQYGQGINPALVIKYLQTGKSPKEIAFILGVTVWAVWKIIQRHQDARTVFVETYPDRYPHKQDAPPKIRIHLLEAVQ